MAWFWTRVEIHKGSIEVGSSEYADLHAAMKTIGFNRSFSYGTRVFSMPPAEYFGQKDQLIAQVKMNIEQAVQSVLKTGQTFSFIVAEIKQFAGNA